MRNLFLVWVVALSIASVLFVAACEQDLTWKMNNRVELSLPPNSTNVKNLGNGWVTFDLVGHHFLFRRSMYDRSASDCITILP